MIAFRELMGSVRFPGHLQTLRRVILSLAVLAGPCGTSLTRAEDPAELPSLQLPDPRISEVYLGNWRNTLLPCKVTAKPMQPPGPHVEPDRPWKVDVEGHYPGWYPGVDVKHLAAAYLACGRDLPLVLRAWELTSGQYQMADGGIQPSTMKDNPQGTWPETNSDQSIVFYPLRLTATIDYLLLGDLIFRYSQDRDWLKSQLPRMRRAATFIAGWTDPDGLLHSDSYDLDQVYREIDGVAQASAILALRRLADLESVAGSPDHEATARNLAERLRAGTREYWVEADGYFAEHLAYLTVATASDPRITVTASSELDARHTALRAIDGVTGIGVDAFGAGNGAAGSSEWAAREETRGAWLRIEFPQPTRICGAIMVNRTDPAVQPGERFARGSLEFSDGGDPVTVEFNQLGISRASVRFPARSVRWIRFRGNEVQGTGGTSAGLAEFRVLPADQPHRRITHGMTDTNFAMVGFNVADDSIAARVWEAFRAREPRFHEWNGVRAPTWISDKAESYTPLELNRRAPRKDCVAMGRTWRYEALMRRRLGDGEGLYQTIRDAIALYDRPSGGGAGFFAERYGLGKFQPGDESQANVPKYTEYPAVFASTILQECLLGLTVDVRGTVSIAPCVPTDWYAKGFGATGCGVVHELQLGFTYSEDKVEGTLSGPNGTRTILVAVPPSLRTRAIQVTVNGIPREATLEQGSCRLDIPIDGQRPSTFSVSAKAVNTDR
jgi:hypothetical protein